MLAAACHQPPVSYWGTRDPGSDRLEFKSPFCGLQALWSSACFYLLWFSVSSSINEDRETTYLSDRVSVMTKQSQVRNGLTHCKRVKTTFLLINVIMTLNSEVKLAQNKIPKLQILLRFELRYVTMSHTWPHPTHGQVVADFMPPVPAVTVGSFAWTDFSPVSLGWIAAPHSATHPHSCFLLVPAWGSHRQVMWVSTPQAKAAQE